MKGCASPITTEKPGYKTSIHHVTHQTAGGGAAGMAGNVLLGGIIGAAVDANNGSTQELIPNPLVIDLEVDAPAVVAPTPEPASAAAIAPTEPQH